MIYGTHNFVTFFTTENCRDFPVRCVSIIGDKVELEIAFSPKLSLIEVDRLSHVEMGGCVSSGFCPPSSLSQFS